MSRTVLGTLMIVMLGSLLFATTALAGGGEEPRQQRIKATAPSKPVSAIEAAARDRALDQARQAAPVLPAPSAPRTVSSPVPTTVMSPSTPKRAIATPSDTADWMLGNGDGHCTPLSQAPDQAANIGRFDNPQDFARKMVQRGHQTFVLNIAADQTRVKVPDLDLNLLFVKPGLCRN